MDTATTEDEFVLSVLVDGSADSNEAALDAKLVDSGHQFRFGEVGEHEVLTLGRSTELAPSGAVDESTGEKGPVRIEEGRQASVLLLLLPSSDFLLEEEVGVTDEAKTLDVSVDSSVGRVPSQLERVADQTVNSGFVESCSVENDFKDLVDVIDVGSLNVSSERKNEVTDAGEIQVGDDDTIDVVARVAEHGDSGHGSSGGGMASTNSTAVMR